jgi:multiple antibiotic resistance protein
MNDTIQQIIVDSLYFLTIINPVSKISVLSALSASTEHLGSRHLRIIAVKSSVIAAAILLAVMVFGGFILNQVFHLQLYSLQITGGIVLFWIGFEPLRKGVFFEREIGSQFMDIAIVPLACPMIAGPAAITASLTLTAQRGHTMAIPAMLIALSINLVIMLLAKRITSILTHFNIMGAIIRITGLFVMTMGLQMALNGASEWLSKHLA